MKTILDVTVCTHSSGGVGRWVRGLSRGLFQINPSHLSIDVPETHPGHETTVKGAEILSPPFWTKIPLLRRALLKRGVLNSTRATRIEKKFGLPDIIHLSGVQPEGKAKRKVVTFFDDTPWVSPESHTALTLEYADKLKKLIDSGAHVLTISNWAAASARKLFNLPETRTGNAGGAAEDIFTPGEPSKRVLDKFNLKPDSYFLHVGSFVPRKNISFLVSCFEKASTGKKLVLAGAERWGDQVAENTAGVVFLSGISDEELLSLYRGASSLLFPSSSEGLGLPVLEALACKVSVVVSEGGALPETTGAHGLILPVLETEPWIRAMENIASGAISENLRQRAESAPRPTWKDAAEKAMEFYRSLK